MPEATVAIVTKDRRDRLRDALHSAMAQEGDIEVMVVDDGSSDGTSDMVADEFPAVRVERFDQSAGLVVRRNQAARLADSPIVVSIDDDASFSSSGVVTQTLADFDHARIAVVAMPYVDRLAGPEEHQRSPDPTTPFAVPTFRGTAYAVRRDVFLALGGFREAIVHQGEEPDFSLRMLDAGWLVRAGRADSIWHDESPARNLERMDTYGRRNELLLAFTYFPFPWNLVQGLAHAAKGVATGVRVRRVRFMLRGLVAGVRACWELRDQRAPVARRTIRLSTRLRRAGALAVADLDSQLPPPDPSEAYSSS